MTLPTTTFAVVAHGKGDLRLDREQLSPAAPDQAIVQIAYGGICGSDIHYWTHGAAGESVLTAPMVLGHEVVGTIVEAAHDGTGPTAGTRVAVHPAGRSGNAQDRYPLDRPNLSPAGTYLGSAARFPHTDGAFAQFVCLRSSMLRPLPDRLTFRDAALTEPASVAWHAVARSSGVRGRHVLVLGAGPIGALIIAVAKRAGAATITAVDLHDKPLAIARALGATTTIHALDSAAIAAVDADVAFESSGSAAGFSSAIAGTTRGGRLVAVGLLPPGPQPVPISLAISRELEIVGSFRFNDEINLVIEALADGSLQVGPIVTHEFGLDELTTAFTTARDAAGSGKVLLRF